MAVTTDDAPHIEPAWSPDGKRLVYVQNEVGLPTMWVINADGSGRTQLSGLPGYVDTPSWSPDGTKIVFAAHLDGEDYQIYVVDSAGNKWQRITHTNTSDGYPAWSPDGKKIVFSSSPKGAVSEDIYVMDTDGSNRVRLTNGPGKSFSPSWSPDGQHIAFTYEGGIASGWEIWKMKPDGTGRTRLTRATSAASLWLDTNPHWSPDSEYIVFEGARDSVDNDIYVVKADGTELYQLATNAVGPAWAPK